MLTVTWLALHFPKDDAHARSQTRPHSSFATCSEIRILFDSDYGGSLYSTCHKKSLKCSFRERKRNASNALYPGSETPPFKVLLIGACFCSETYQ